MAGAWTMLVHQQERKKAISSTQVARCGIRSETSRPDWPCFWKVRVLASSGVSPLVNWLPGFPKPPGPRWNGFVGTFPENPGRPRFLRVLGERGSRGWHQPDSACRGSDNNSNLCPRRPALALLRLLFLNILKNKQVTSIQRASFAVAA